MPRKALVFICAHSWFKKIQEDTCIYVETMSRNSVWPVGTHGACVLNAYGFGEWGYAGSADWGRRTSRASLQVKWISACYRDAIIWRLYVRYISRVLPRHHNMTSLRSLYVPHGSLLPTTYYLLPTTYYLLLTTYYLLLTTYYLVSPPLLVNYATANFAIQWFIFIFAK